MTRPYRFIALLLFVCFIGVSQEKKEEGQQVNAVDSLTTDLKEKGVVVETASFEKRTINPLAPSKAAFYSAVFPGLGQIYNKRYWKVPLVYGAIGGGIYAYSFNNTEYNRVRDAFKRRRAGFTDDEFFPLNDGTIDPANPRISDTALQDAQERFQRDRDLWLLLTIAFYALNIIDANVDAHLKQYNVSEDLAMDIKPFLELNSVTSNANYGFAMVIKF